MNAVLSSFNVTPSTFNPVSMSEIIVARRYAEALYQEAEASGCIEKVDEDISVIQASMTASRELVRFFESPIISREKKIKIIETLFKERVQPLTLRFLQLLVKKNREQNFPTVVKAYGDLRDKLLGIVEAKARIAHHLNEDEEKKLVQVLEKMTGKRIRLSVELEPELIGGLVIRVGDTIYDGSVRHQLAALRDKLEHRSYLMN